MNTAIWITIVVSTVGTLAVILAGRRRPQPDFPDEQEFPWTDGVRCPHCGFSEEAEGGYLNALRFEQCPRCGADKYDFEHGLVRLAPMNSPAFYEFKYYEQTEEVPNDSGAPSPE